MIQPTAPAQPHVAANGPVPPLKDGDRLTRAEFERRYEAMPELKKAELINGVVHMPSPIRYSEHARPDRLLNLWLCVYELHTQGVEGGNNPSVRLGVDSEPQPDLMLMISAGRWGRVRITEDHYLEGGPEFMAEISASSVALDLGEKLELYQESGVGEYVVWRVLDQEVDWFVRRDGRFQRLAMDDHGIYRSEGFPGLWLDVPALVRGDVQALAATLQRGLATPEHAAFVTRLNPPAQS